MRVEIHIFLLIDVLASNLDIILISIHSNQSTISESQLQTFTDMITGVFVTIKAVTVHFSLKT